MYIYENNRDMWEIKRFLIKFSYGYDFNNKILSKFVNDFLQKLIRIPDFKHITFHLLSLNFSKYTLLKWIYVRNI